MLESSRQWKKKWVASSMQTHQLALGSSNTSERLYILKSLILPVNEIQSHKDKDSGDMDADSNCPSSRIHKGDSYDSRIMEVVIQSMDGVLTTPLDNDLEFANMENNRLR